ncbi:MAG: efflux RND transporter periplasmic adaptor subunit [Elusimicrobia bacterium]|nr:efflux RND transporter periplasmic adaptor subunit [Elusimicrobiota bacterium]
MNKLIQQIKEKIRQIEERIMHSLPEIKKLFTKKVIIICIAGAVAIILGIVVANVFFFKHKAGPEEMELPQIKVKKVKRQDFTEKYTVMGTIKGSIENELRFETDGVIASYNFKEGAKIGRGQIICSLDPKDAYTKTDFARSKYTSEQSAYFSTAQRLKVYEDLFKMKALAESKLQEARFETQSAEAKMKAAQSEYELAQSALSKTNLVAPADGLLAEILIRQGDYVTPQDIIAKFISAGATIVEADIPEKDMTTLKIGLAVKVDVDAYPDKMFMGILREIAPTVKERTRTTTIKITLENKDGLLRSGMFARGVIALKEFKDAILVPTDSVVTLGGQTFLVPIVKPDATKPGEGVIEMRTVKLGDKLSSQTVIEDGLLVDDLVVIATQAQLSDGVKVKFIEEIQERPEISE